MRNSCHNSSLSPYAILGYVVVPALLLMFGLRVSADTVVRETNPRPDSASSPISPSLLSSTSRQKRAPGWGKRSNFELDGDTVSYTWDDGDSLDKRAPGWGKRAPGWGKRAPGWGKRAPGWGKRAPGWGKRAPGWGKRAPGWGERAPGWGERAPGWEDEASRDFDYLRKEEDDKEERGPGWGKRSDIDLDSDKIFSSWDDDELDPDVEKRAPGWGKRAPGWGKRAPGWGKRAPGWGKRAPGWGKRSAALCDGLMNELKRAKTNISGLKQTYLEVCGTSTETNEAARKRT